MYEILVTVIVIATGAHYAVPSETTFRTENACLDAEFDHVDQLIDTARIYAGQADGLQISAECKTVAGWDI